MNAHLKKSPESEKEPAAGVKSAEAETSTKAVLFQDSRKAAVLQRKQQEKMRDSQVISNRRINRLVPSMQKSPIQRLVTYKGGGPLPWHSDVTDQYYETKKAAEIGESHFNITKQGKRGRKLKDNLEKERRPTMYSFMKGSERASSPDQGPHTVAHVYTRMNLGVTSNSSINDLNNRFAIIQDIPTVTAVFDEVKNRIPDTMEKPGKVAKINKALETYTTQYQMVNRMLNHGDYSDERGLNEGEGEPNLRRYIYDLIRRLIDLNPMATYKWVNTNATEEEMAYKGEGFSTNFNDYLDENWIKDPHLPTNRMNAFITSLHPPFNMANYLAPRAGMTNANKRRKGEL